MVTQEKLFRFKIALSSICPECGNAVADSKHLFVECLENTGFWEEFSNFWKTLTGYNINLNVRNILLGFDGETYKSKLLNYILLLAKKYIYTSFWLKKKRDFNAFKSIIRQKCSIEQNIAQRNDTVNIFLEKWEIILVHFT